MSLAEGLIAFFTLLLLIVVIILSGAQLELIRIRIDNIKNIETHNESLRGYYALQLIHKYNEAIALDYVVPFKLIQLEEID